MIRSTTKLFIVVLLSVFLFSDAAMASVEGGNYDVIGALTVKVSVKGWGSKTVRTSASDLFTFDASGAFTMIDMVGTWSEIKNKFNVTLDPSHMQTYFESMLAYAGYPADVTVTSAVFTGKENVKSGAISGKISITMGVHLINENVFGTMKATINYKGSKQAAIATMQQGENPLNRSITEVLKRAVDVRNWGDVLPLQ